MQSIAKFLVLDDDAVVLPATVRPPRSAGTAFQSVLRDL